MVTKNLMKNSKNPISLEFRAPCINGQTDSYQDSTEFHSRNQIDSFNHMNSPTTKHKKDSIYKATLQKTGGGSMIGIKPVEKDMDSFYSNTGSNASSQEAMDMDIKNASKSQDTKPKSHRNSEYNDSEEENDNEKIQHKRSKFGRDI